MGRKARGGGGWGEQASLKLGLFPICAVVSRRVEELARPKRFYSEFYNSSR